MVLSVANIKEILIIAEYMAHPLRLMKLSLVKAAIYKSNFAVTNHMHACKRRFVHYDDSVVA